MTKKTLISILPNQVKFMKGNVLWFQIVSFPYLLLSTSRSILFITVATAMLLKYYQLWLYNSWVKHVWIIRHVSELKLQCRMGAWWWYVVVSSKRKSLKMKNVQVLADRHEKEKSGKKWLTKINVISLCTSQEGKEMGEMYNSGNLSCITSTFCYFDFEAIESFLFWMGRKFKIISGCKPIYNPLSYMREGKGKVQLENEWIWDWIPR